MKCGVETRRFMNMEAVLGLFAVIVPSVSLRLCFIGGVSIIIIVIRLYLLLVVIIIYYYYHHYRHLHHYRLNFVIIISISIIFTTVIMNLYFQC